MIQIKHTWACKHGFGPQMIISRTGTKFSAMLRNRKWTYVEVAPILRLININICTSCLDKLYRDHHPLTCSTIRKGDKMKRVTIQCMKLEFQISSTSFVHLCGFGLSTYQHPRPNEVEEFVLKISLKLVSHDISRIKQESCTKVFNYKH